MEPERAGWKFRLGIACLIYSFLPLCTVGLLAFLPLSASQNVLAGAIWLGSGEAAFLVAVALLGKPFVQAVKTRVLGWFKRQPGPPRPVGKTRHAMGVVLFMGSFLPYFAAEALLLWGDPSPGGLRCILKLLFAGDLAFIASLFLLGEPFWRKLKGLFTWSDAQAGQGTNAP